MNTKILLLILIISFALTSYANENANENASEFKVTYSIVFNSINLQQAAEKEKEIRKIFKDACKIEIKLEGVQESDQNVYLQNLPYYSKDGWIINY